MKRQMINQFEGFKFYESTFDMENGLLTRVVEVPHKTQRWDFDGLPGLIAKQLHPGEHGDTYEARNALKERWGEKFGYRREAFSPAPETLDISITDWCNFGCTYCYQSSEARYKHAPKELAVNTVRQFTVAPYQVAIGGGEPTAHPDFPWILHSVRECNSVPNFTTAGHVWRQEVIDAANAACGGVSLTFHAFKGEQYFRDTYKKWRAALKRPQLNVHLIADKDVAVNLSRLMAMQPDIGKISLVLLAYYPNVGRSTLMNIMPKRVFNEELPALITQFIDRGNRVAFSEGLLPFFLSRPEIGVDTTFASRSEGYFSAYVDPDGELFASSFDASPPEERAKDLDGRKYVNGVLMETDGVTPSGQKYSDGEDAEWTYWVHGTRVHLPTKAKTIDDLPKKTLQDAWDTYHTWGGEPRFNECDGCRQNDRCATPNANHYFVCAYSEVNKKPKPLSVWAEIAIAERKLWDERWKMTEAKTFTAEASAAWQAQWSVLLRKKRGLEGANEEEIQEEVARITERAHDIDADVEEMKKEEETKS